jgi:C4-dicarboxylate-specific signal transduction histidine kinase
MTDEAKLALHDLFIAYLIESSAAITSTSMYLALRPQHSSQAIILNDSLDSAKFLLTKVFNPQRVLFLSRLLLLIILMGNREMSSFPDRPMKIC